MAICQYESEPSIMAADRPTVSPSGSSALVARCETDVGASTRKATIPSRVVTAAAAIKVMRQPISDAQYASGEAAPALPRVPTEMNVPASVENVRAGKLSVNTLRLP